MKRFIKDDIFGMSNLYPRKTGLPRLIWFDNSGKSRNPQHSLPRVKIQNTPGDKVVNDAFVVSISKDPQILAGKCKLDSKDLKTMLDFIANHYQDFVDQWNQDIDEDELKESLYIK